VSAWHWWLAITPHDYKDGLLKVSSSLESESIETTKAFWVFGNYSRFIRPGFTRIEINNPDQWNGLMASAYKSPDNRKIVLVVVNGAINKKTISIRLAASDLRIDRDSIEVFTTDHNHDHRMSMPSGELDLPPRSITTVMAKIVQD
jgi:O-glycosyl hydrolase